MARSRQRPLLPPLLTALGLGVIGSAACFPDWDKLDPSNGSSAGGAATGTGGGEGGSTFCDPGETAPCYGGPEGTENVGACMGGETTCAADGSGFGPCEGEVQPGDETCDNDIDDDCDGEINELDAGCSCTPGELVACYEGPTATEGVGICVGGNKLCGPNGDVFTACVGQLVPMHEECTTAMADDDCDGDLNEGCPLWGKAFGVNGNNHDTPHGLATMPNGDFYVAGIAQGPLDFGVTPPLPALGLSDIFVVKLDSDGNEIWARRFGSAGHEEALSAAADAAGNVYVAGEFAATIDFGGVGLDLTAVGTEDGWLAKLDPDDGTVLWTASIGGVNADVTVMDIAVDATGNVAVTGDFIAASPDTVDFGSGPESSSSRDGFVQKYDAAGNLTWGMAFGGSGLDAGRSVAFAGTSLAISGTFGETIDFGGPGEIDVSGEDGFIALIDAANVQQWIETYGDDGDQSVNELASDGTNIYGVGEGNGVINLDGNAVAADLDDLFVVALDPAGNQLWGHHYVGPSDQHTGGATANATTVWFGSSHQEVTDYGDGPLTSADDDDWALVKLDATTGDTVISVRVGGDNDDDPFAMGMDSQGALYVTGDCRSNIDFGLGPIDLTGSYDDICMGKLPP